MGSHHDAEAVSCRFLSSAGAGRIAAVLPGLHFSSTARINSGLQNAF